MMQYLQFSLKKIDIYTRIFFIFLILYIVFQIFCFYKIQTVFPYGLPLEDAYHPSALNLLNHKIYGFDYQGKIIPTSGRPPLYSFLLACIYKLFGQERIIGIIFNNVLLTLSILTIFLSLKKISSVAGLLAASIIIFDPIYLEQANILQSDIAFLFFTSLVIYFSIKFFSEDLSIRNLLFIVFFMISATYVRAHGMYLWVGLIISILLIQKIHIKKKIVFILVITFLHTSLIGLWKYRNYKVVNQSDFASMISTHLMNFFIPEIYIEKYKFSETKAREQILLDNNLDKDFWAFTKRNFYQYYGRNYGGYKPPTDEEPKIIKKIAIKTVAKHPLSTFKSVTKNIPELYLSSPPTIYSLFFSEERYGKWLTIIEMKPGESKKYIKRFYERQKIFYKEKFYFAPILLIINKLINFFIILFCAIFIYKSFIYKKYSKYKELTIFLLFYISILTLIAIMSAEGRFRLPIMPAINILGSLYLINNYKVKKFFDIYKNKVRNYTHR